MTGKPEVTCFVSPRPVARGAVAGSDQYILNPQHSSIYAPFFPLPFEFMHPHPRLMHQRNGLHGPMLTAFFAGHLQDRSSRFREGRRRVGSESANHGWGWLGYICTRTETPRAVRTGQLELFIVHTAPPESCESACPAFYNNDLN